MLRGLVVSNGIGAELGYPSRPEISFDSVEIDQDFELDPSGYDLIVAPNGTDHLALFRQRHVIREFLDAGHALLCCCGWFVDWVPHNRWIHDNSHATRDIRHFAGKDTLGLLQGVELAALDHNEYGISGWWACGFIEPASGADALIKDTWGRALVVVDSHTTKGLMLLTASGPIGDYSRVMGGSSPIGQLYENFLGVLVNKPVN